MAETTEDPFLWLEVKGERPSPGSRNRRKTEGELKADPLFQKLLDDAMAVLTAPDRIPYVYRGGHLYNFSGRDDDARAGASYGARMSSPTRPRRPPGRAARPRQAVGRRGAENGRSKALRCLAPENTRALPRPAFARRRRRGRDPRVRRQHKTFVGGRLPARRTNKSTVEVDRRRHGAGRHRFRRGLIDHVGLSAASSSCGSAARRSARRRPCSRARPRDTAAWPIVHHDGAVPVMRAVDFFDARKLSRRPDGSQDAAAAALCGDARHLQGKRSCSRCAQDWAAAGTSPYRQGLAARLHAGRLAGERQSPAIKTLFTPTERTAIDTVDFPPPPAPRPGVLDNVRAGGSTSIPRAAPGRRPSW